MKNAWRAQAVGAILSCLVVAGCSSTQPDQIDTRSASVSFETKASVLIWDCYESPQLTCFPVLDGQAQQVADRSVPWRYSLRITIIRAGTYNEVVALSTTGQVGSSVERGDLVEDFISLTDYDPDMPPIADRDGYTNGHRVSSGSPLYLASIFVDAGIPNILDTVSTVPETPATFNFDLNSGDTVIVRARKQDVGASPTNSANYENIILRATLAIGGIAVSTQGPQTSSIDDGSGFTFSFTVK